jgi:hypothetical protein
MGEANTLRRKSANTTPANPVRPESQLRVWPTDTLTSLEQWEVVDRIVSPAGGWLREIL